ncbi:MAG TPA: phosphatase PAP2 family protein [Gemmatimonadaceae bacterium]
MRPHALLGQTQPLNPRDTTHSQKQAPFFIAKDAYLALGFIAGTIAMIPLDRQIARSLLDSGAQANSFFKHASTGVEVIASPGAYYIGGTLYIVGRIGKWERVADLGWHGTEAVVFAQGVTYVIKGIVGRGRPFLSNGDDPDDFAVGRGFKDGDWTSFPSGHTSTAFAAAAAVTNETTRWWPKSTWIVGPLMYGGAAAVGLSRMYHSKHWGSDVVIGAAIGTFSGRKVVQYAHGHPGNLIDRIMLRTRVQPNPQDGGVKVGLSYDW